MNERERARYDMFIRVRQFGSENPADFPPASVGRVQFAEINAVIGSLNDAAADQSSGAARRRSGQKSKDTARENLREARRTSPPRRVRWCTGTPA